MGITRSIKEIAMIEGLKLSITSDQLKQLIEQRIEYHMKKAAFCEGKAAAQKKEQVEFDEMAEEQFKIGTSNAPMHSWEASARHHRDKVTTFTFRRDHLIMNETFILSDDDLRTLEVLGRW